MRPRPSTHSLRPATRWVAYSILSEDLLREFWSRPRFDLEADASAPPSAMRRRGARFRAPSGGSPSCTPSTPAAGSAASWPRWSSAGLRRGPRGPLACTRPSSPRTRPPRACWGLAGTRGARAPGTWTSGLRATGRPPAPPAGVGRGPRSRSGLPEQPHRIIEEAFEDHWDFSPTSYEDFLDQGARGDDFDPAPLVLALDGEEPVGVSRLAPTPIEGGSTTSACSGHTSARGIATALLRESFRRSGTAATRSGSTWTRTT